MTDEHSMRIEARTMVAEKGHKRNSALLAAIAKSGMRQKEVAWACGIREATLSRIVNCAREPYERTKRDIAAVLGVEVAEIF